MSAVSQVQSCGAAKKEDEVALVQGRSYQSEELGVNGEGAKYSRPGERARGRILNGLNRHCVVEGWMSRRE